MCTTLTSVTFTNVLLHARLLLLFNKLYEYIEYELSLTYRVLTTTRPSYLRNLVSLQPLSQYPPVIGCHPFHPQTITLLKFTDLSFRYALPCL